MSTNKETVIIILDELCGRYKAMPNKKFQLRAIKTAVTNLKKLDGDITSGKDASNKVTGIGKGIIKRIDEILSSGHLKELNDLDSGKAGAGSGAGSGASGGAGGGTSGAKRAKKGDKSIINVTGIGPVAVKKLQEKGYTNIDDLKAGLLSGKVKLTHHQKLGVKYYDDFLERIPRDEIVKMEKILRKTMNSIGSSDGTGGKLILEICGSYRRGREDCGDIDVLMTFKGIKGNSGLTGMESDFLKLFVKDLTSRGFIVDHLTTNIKTKYMGICKLDGGGVARRIDIRAVPYNYFYPALIYFTGSKEFNIEIRRKALEKGYSLSEYGFKEKTSDKLITFDSEDEIFTFLGIDYVEPTAR